MNHTNNLIHLIIPNFASPINFFAINKQYEVHLLSPLVWLTINFLLLTFIIFIKRKKKIKEDKNSLRLNFPLIIGDIAFSSCDRVNHDTALYLSLYY